MSRSRQRAEQDTPAADCRNQPDRPSWLPRLLVLSALALGAVALLAMWGAPAQADEPTGGAADCSPIVTTASSQDAAATLSDTAPEAGVAGAGCPTSDAPVTETPAPSTPPVAPEVAVAPETAAPTGATPADASVGTDVAADPAITSPVSPDAALTPVAVPVPALAIIEPTPAVAPAVVPAVVPDALVDEVMPAAAFPSGVSLPECPAPSAVAAVAGARSGERSSSGSTEGTSGASSGTSSAVATAAGEGPAPADAPPPLAPRPFPLPLPAPLPMPAPVPAGSSSLTSSGSISYGAGETQHLDGPYAYLVSGVSAKPAPATGGAGRGFGGSVVGGADDPGVRPG